jgi:hypothetical protein
MNPDSYASADPPARDLAEAAAGAEPPTAAAEILILLFPLDPAADTGLPPNPVITVIALELAGLLFVALMIQAARLRQYRRDRGARGYSRPVMSSPS